MTVAELIEKLKEHKQNLQVEYYNEAKDVFCKIDEIYLVDDFYNKIPTQIVLLD